MKHWTPLILVVLLTTGCSAALSPQRATDSASEIEELKRRVLELQKQSTVHELEIDRLRQRLAALEGPAANRRGSTGDNQPAERLAATRRTPPPRRVIEETPPPPPRQPRIDESNLDEEAFGQPVEPPLDSNTGSRRSNGQGEAGAGTPSAAVRAVPPPGQTPEPTPTPQNNADPVPPEAQALYDQGYTRYHEGRFIDAESTFRRFLQSYSNTDLADNAQYWIGESRYARKDFQGALSAFRETVQRFPDGNKVPDAMIKAGQCFEKVGDRSAARDTYREVMERFPNSVAAVAAAEYLEELR
ncbi:MAG: tol-pal system protein YbgF [Acidobacteriota bacterium]|nr:tol-pal system protein YbgF [Acidobacteriota bacterium]